MSCKQPCWNRYFVWFGIISDFAIGSCRDDTDDFPANADDYELVEEIGVGATARVCHHPATPGVENVCPLI